MSFNFHKDPMGYRLAHFGEKKIIAVFLEKFIYLFSLFLAALVLVAACGLSSCSGGGCSVVAVHRLLTAVASLLPKHGL